MKASASPSCLPESLSGRSRLLFAGSPLRCMSGLMPTLTTSTEESKQAQIGENMQGVKFGC